MSCLERCPYRGVPLFNNALENFGANLEQTVAIDAEIRLFKPSSAYPWPSSLSTLVLHFSSGPVSLS